jgi:LCP family protein required for cell wall assembly
MSDGDNATPGQHRAPDPNGDNQWLTRSARPKRGAAPWERAPVPPDGPHSEHVTPDRPAESQHSDTGNHAKGITVADLFARVTGDVPEVLQKARAAEPDSAPDEQTQDWPDSWPSNGLDRDAIQRATERDSTTDKDGATQQDGATHKQDEPPTVPTTSAYASEIPDLAPVARRRYRTDDRVPMSRVVATAPPPADMAQTAVLDIVPRRRRRSILLAGRSVAALFAVLALVLTGGAWQWTSSKNNRMNTVAALDPNSRDILDPNAQFGDENFLIVGVDSRYGHNSDMGAGGTEDADGARSDSVILVNIPANRKRVVAVSFPRDLAINPMQCKAWDAATGQYGPVYDEESGTYGPEEVYTETKLNSAYSFGGPKCLVKVIQKISGLSINRFMAVDFVGFAKMVDALGGVEVCSSSPLEDYELGTVLANAGRQTIDGTTALNYVRARQITTEVNGDYGRIKRQQLFLSSLLRSLISKDTFFSLSKLNDVVNLFINDSSVDNVTTKDLVDLGQSLQGVSAGRITFVTVPTTGYADEYGNEQPRTDDIRALFDAIINDDPLPGENDQNETTTPATPDNAEAPAVEPTEIEAQVTQQVTAATELVDAVITAPQDVTVHVSNSTGQTGLGSTVSTELQAHGFNVDDPDDYPTTLGSTTVMYSSGNEQAAATVAAAFGHPPIERVSGLGQEVHVVLGSDVGPVSAPPPTGSAVQVSVTHESSAVPTHLPEDLTVTNGADTTCE